MYKAMYAIQDKTVGVYLNPLHCVNDGEAIRLFTNFVNDPKGETNISKYPEQFSLWFIGTFDDTTGTFESGLREIIGGNSVKTVGPEKYTLEKILDIIKQEISK